MVPLKPVARRSRSVVPVAPMLRLTPKVLVPLAACIVWLGACTPPPIPDASQTRSREAIERVFEAFNRCDVEALVANYSDDNLVFFTGSTGAPLTNRAGLRTYFSYLTEHPCNDPRSIKHGDIRLHARPLGAAAAVVHANTVVTYLGDQGVAVRRPFYFTFVLQDAGGRWLVISQNAQPVSGP